MAETELLRRFPPNRLDQLASWSESAKGSLALELTASGFRPTHAATLASALRRNPSVVQLELGRNPTLGDAGLRMLLPALCEINGLTLLGLDSTGLSNESAASLVSLLSRGSPLMVLKLQHNRLGDQAALSIASALESGSATGGLALERLMLQRNRISDRGAAAFQAVISKTRLVELDLRFNLIVSKPILAAIQDGCANNQRQMRFRREQLPTTRSKLPASSFEDYQPSTGNPADFSDGSSDGTPTFSARADRKRQSYSPDSPGKPSLMPSQRQQPSVLNKESQVSPPRAVRESHTRQQRTADPTERRSPDMCHCRDWTIAATSSGSVRSQPGQRVGSPPSLLEPAPPVARPSAAPPWQLVAAAFMGQVHTSPQVSSRRTPPLRYAQQAAPTRPFLLLQFSAP